MILDLEDTFIVGQDAFFDSMAPKSTFRVIFEDDLTTGYFYSVEKSKKLRILDALHIYNVADVIGKEKPSKIQIYWTDDGQFASLLINNYCHAIFDFTNKAGYCRNAFPDSNREWTAISERRLTDDLIAILLEEK